LKFTERNVRYRPLIGLKVKVLDSTDRSLVGLEGLVLDDGRNALRIAVAGKTHKVVTLIKGTSVLQVTTPDGTFVVRGIELIGRPEERLKRALS
jgi:ribonuclease P protein subunit POP4